MKNMTRSTKYNLFPTNLLILALLFPFFLLIIPISCDTPPLYTPPDNFALDCGSPEISTAPDGRNWVGDIASNLYHPIQKLDSNKSVTFSAQKQPTNRVPYFTARISHSEFTYVFPVTAGQKFIRLHFYPALYGQDFDPSKAFFSVKANHFTLLTNFSASLTAASLGLDIIAKEFCINVDDEDQRLSVTFTPSKTSSLDAYAFINGIEIVSMPTNLYYTSAENPGLTFIGYQQGLRPLENGTALEMLYRLNVGGRTIPTSDDTGMFRSWSEDDKYCSIIGALPVNMSIKLIITKISNYTAPAEVYLTARSMGNNKTTNKGYNLTWNLPVDSGFTYMVRLHFCEFQPQVTKPNDREFQIFIANQTAERQADVIVWSGGNGVPVYRDYAVMVNPGRGRENKQNLSIALHPGPDSRTRHSDAILNGIEVFKLSDSGDNLAGPNPDPLIIPPPASPSILPPANRRSNRTTTLVAAIVGGVLSGVVAVSLLGFLIFRQRRRVKDSRSSGGRASWWTSVSYSTIKTFKTDGSSLPSNICRDFSLAEIKAATSNFDGAFIIGRGGFGDVYQGYIDGGATPVAIKRLKPGSRQGVHEFKTEIEMLSHLRYVHLVSLIGYCNDGREMILVYDYMPRGTLRDHLYNTDNPPLSWKQRLEISIGAALGLNYLHAGAKCMIIHRDVKTTNILLDDKWVAKVSDFGLSKINPSDMANTHVSTAVKGSFGYMDPEYFRRQQLTEKSDVYSFGVVLFEVLCGRPPLNKMLGKDQVSLAVWAQNCYQNGTLDQIVDPHLMGKIAPECLKKFGEIAVSCLHDEGIQRPSMNDVVWSLEFALKLQESAEQEGSKLVELGDGGAPIEVKDKGQDDMVDKGRGRTSSWRSTEVTMTSNSGTSTSTSNNVSSGAVFSEIMNPKAR